MCIGVQFTRTVDEVPTIAPVFVNAGRILCFCEAIELVVCSIGAGNGSFVGITCMQER
jgi:hypothetical protein